MRLFALLNFQHTVAYFFAALIFMILFGAALAYSHFHTRKSKEAMETVVHHYRAGLSARKAPFPLVMILIIVGTVIWSFFYILMHGLLEIRI